MKEESDFGDFEEIVDEKSQKEEESNPENSAPARVRLPRGNELIGIILQRYGGNRMEILATDGKTRNCRVPGKYKRRLWLRPREIVMIVPWSDDDTKGDIIYKYPPAAVAQLKKKGMLDSLNSDF